MRINDPYLVAANKRVVERLKERYHNNFYRWAEKYPAGAWPSVNLWREVHPARKLAILAPGTTILDFDNERLISAMMNNPNWDIWTLNRLAVAVPRINDIFSLTTEPAVIPQLAHYASQRRKLGLEKGNLILSAFSDPALYDLDLNLFHYLLDSRGEGPEPNRKELKKFCGRCLPHFISAGTVSTQAINAAVDLGYEVIACLGYDFVYWEGRESAINPELPKNTFLLDLKPPGWEPEKVLSDRRLLSAMNALLMDLRGLLAEKRLDKTIIHNIVTRIPSWYPPKPGLVFTAKEFIKNL